MARISFFIHERGKETERKVKNFLNLCHQLGIKTLFHKKRGVEEYRADFFSFVGIGINHVVELHIRAQKVLVVPIRKNLAKVFSISEDCPHITMGEEVEKRLSKIQDTLKKEFITECSQCNRSSNSFLKYCQYCGNQMQQKLKMCSKCAMLYVPSFMFCPDCSQKLVDTKMDVWEFRDPGDFLYGVPRSQVKLK